MGDKSGLADRVNALRLNVDALEKVEVLDLKIPNIDGKKASLQIYAAITTNDGFITPEGAHRGLAIFGEELRADARANPGKHPSIDTLEFILNTQSKQPSKVYRRNSGLIPERVTHALQSQAVWEGHSTPFHIYDEKGIRDTARKMYAAFGILPGFTNYFAVKALPNPHILNILAEEGMGADCSSIPELHTAQAVGLPGKKIMFTSNNTSDESFTAARSAEAIINLDDITFIDALEKATGGLPSLLCFRYNPGGEKEGNSIIGDPSDAKYGLTKEQIFDAYARAREKGVKKFGLHTMVASNELNPDYFIETANLMFNLAADIKKKTGVELSFVNLGGGIGIPYRPEQKPVDLEYVAKGIKQLYDEKLTKQNLTPEIYMECGRMITGPNGWVVTKVRHVMEKYKKYIGVDAPNAALDRAGRYIAYHHVSALGRENELPTETEDVVSSLCENVKFTINRQLPPVHKGDVLLIHSTGAHGIAMKNNYNSEFAPPELLLEPDGNVKMIRRAETEEDLNRTVVGFYPK